MCFAQRTANLRPEGAYQVLARAQELEAKGQDIIHLEIGQPDRHLTRWGVCLDFIDI